MTAFAIVMAAITVTKKKQTSNDPSNGERNGNNYIHNGGL